GLLRAPRALGPSRRAPAPGLRARGGPDPVRDEPTPQFSRPVERPPPGRRREGRARRNGPGPEAPPSARGPRDHRRGRSEPEGGRAILRSDGAPPLAFGPLGNGRPVQGQPSVEERARAFRALGSVPPRG